MRKNDSVRAHSSFFQKCTRVGDWDSVSDTDWISQHGFLGTLYKDPLDNADDLAGLNVIQPTAAIVRLGSGVGLKHVAHVFQPLNYCSIK